MSPAALGFISACLWFGIFMVAHMAILHWRGGTNPSQVLLRAILAAAAGAIVSVALMPIPGWEALVLAETYALAVIACLFVLYGPFFYTIYTSLSIQSLLLMMKMGGRAPANKLVERFASRSIIEGRLMTMVASHYLVHQDGRFSLTSKGRRIAHLFRMLKTVWRLGAGG
jgi:hypothetical protein